MGTCEERGYLNSGLHLFYLSDIPRQEFGFHYHNFGEIIIFLEEKVSYLIKGRTCPLMSYDIVPINHNEIHRPDIDQSIPYEHIIVYLSPGFITPYKTGEYDLSERFQHAKAAHSDVLRVCSLEKSSLPQIIRNLEQVCAKGGYANELYRQVLFLEFMIQLNHAYLIHRLDYLGTRCSDQKILAIIGYINTHLFTNLNIDTLPEALYVGKYHMIHQLKQEIGCTISHYINGEHLPLARGLSSDDTPITQICYDCGFKNCSTFSRVYKSSFGKSPKPQRAVGTR